MTARLDRWERQLRWAVEFVPYAGLAISTLLAFVIPWPTRLLGLQLAVVGAAALWMLWLVTLHPTWADNRPLMVAYFVGLLGAITTLVVLNPLYGFFAFAGYLHAVYALRGRWQLIGVAATSVAITLSQVGGVPTVRTPGGRTAFAIILPFNLCVACAMVLLARVLAEQAERRRVMLAELAETNAKLEGALAENAGLHAQLLTQAREAGVLDERQRMAGEIHDTIAQGLTGIVTQLEAASAGRDGWRRHVDAATRLARESLSEARRSVHALRPEALDGARLPEALAAVVTRWSADAGVVAALTTTGTAVPLVPAIELVLLRTAQEALANVAKHAGASRVGLTLSYMGDVVTLDVRDDGVGFAVDGPRSESSFGLTAMRDRVLGVTGSLDVESEPGAGTAISASVPAIPATGAPETEAPETRTPETEAPETNTPETLARIASGSAVRP
jgi:signal transduction histidine kinase